MLLLITPFKAPQRLFRLDFVKSNEARNYFRSHSQEVKQAFQK